MREEETDIRLSEHFEAQEYVESSEYYPVPEEICESREEWKQTPQKEEHGKRGKLHLLKRMGYLVAASLAVVTISRAMTGETDAQVIQPVQSGSRVMDFSASGYDSFGEAYGGVIPVEKDGRWGAVDYDFREIIPCVYDAASVPSEKGLLSLVRKVTDHNGGELLYSYVYDAQGKVVFSQELPAGAESNSIGTTSDLYFTEDFVSDYSYFHSNGKCLYSGSLVSGAPCSMADDRILLHRMQDERLEFGVMDRTGRIVWKSAKAQEKETEITKKKNIFQKIWHFILYLEMPEEEEDIPDFESGGNDSYDDPCGDYIDIYDPCGDYYDIEDPCGDDWIEEDPAMQEQEQSVTQEPVVYSRQYDYVPFNSFQKDVAFLSEWHAYLSGAGSLMDDNYNVIASFGLQNCIPDNQKGFLYQGVYQEQYDSLTSFRFFYYDGGSYKNYGTKMVWHFGEKDLLVDLALCPGMTEETMDNRIVQAIHDRILFSRETYWLFEDTYQGVHFIGYMDHDGKVKKGYDNATEFAKGQALVVEQGKTYLIDDRFRKIKALGKTEEIGKAGDLLYIRQNGSTMFVNL